MRIRHTRELRAHRAALTLSLCLSFAILRPPISPSALAAIDARCDLADAVSTARFESYRFRLAGTRCEGRFAAPVAAIDMDVVGYMDGDGLLSTDADIVVTWPGDAKTAVHLVARDLIPGFHYRMDTHLPDGAHRYVWPSDVRARLGLDADHVAILATAPHLIGGRTIETAFPVRYGPLKGR